MSNPRYLIGIGFEKCGTTSLYRFLSQSPVIAPSRMKETFFFSRHFDKGLDYYRSLFVNPDRPIHLDITPSYWRNGLLNLSQFEEDFRIVIMMRNPVERVFSYYMHYLSAFYAHGYSPWVDFGFPFSVDERFCPAFTNSLSQEMDRNRYLYVGRYYHTIKACFDLFGRDRVLCLFQADLSDPNRLIRKIEELLEKDIAMDDARMVHDNRLHLPFYLTSAEAQIIALNDYGNPGSLHLCAQTKVFCLRNLSAEQIQAAMAAQEYWTSSVSANDVAYIYDRFYRADVARLEDLLQRDLSDWRVAKPISYRKIPLSEIQI